MSAIFVSHSSKDKQLAVELHERLVSEGYTSVFLDVDRDDGIVAGERWEQVLYRELRGCQVFIALMSENWISSRWCFAEATHAREKGKRVIGLRLAPTIEVSVLADTQFIDFSNVQRKSGYERLWTALENMIDPRGLVRWDAKTRPLYPGLNPFDELDAAVYFGRDWEADGLAELLRDMRRDRESPAGLLLLLGASGSGKSSLAQAGIVPRLRRERKDWLVIDPFRPGMRPITEMAKAVEATFARCGKARGWEPIREALFHAVSSANGRPVVDLADQLRMASRCREASILLVVDQVEEVFSTAEEASVFLRLLELILKVDGTPYRVLGTLRSDWLVVFQTHRNTRHLAYRPYHLALMKPENFRQVIEGPARVAGMDLEDGLVDAMLADANTPEALPLLAFALYQLWQMWKRAGARQVLTLDDYRKVLGGLEGVITRTAEKALGPDPMPESTERFVRRAFSALARITEGRFIKQRARWDDLPTEAHTILDRLVQARLLVSDMQDGERLIEVVHETVFRAWDRLKMWLNMDIEFLMWRERLGSRMREWEEANKGDANERFELVKATFLRGARLVEAERWFTDRKQDLIPSEVAFIEASANQHAQEEEAAAQERRRLTRQVGRFFATSALQVLDRMPRRALLLSIEAVRVSHTTETEGTLRYALANTGGLSLRGHPGAAFGVTFDPEGRWVAAGGSEGEISLWTINDLDVPPKKLLAPSGSQNRHALAVDPGGRWLASADLERVVLWFTADFSRAPIPVPMPNEESAHAVGFDTKGQWLAVGCGDRCLRIWAVDPLKGPTRKPLAIVRTSAEVLSLAFDPRGRWIAFVNDESDVFVLPLSGLKAGAKKAVRPRVLPGGRGVARCVAVDPHARYLATAGGSQVHLWSIAALDRQPRVIQSVYGEVECIAFAPDGESLVLGGENGSVWFVASDGSARESLPLRFHEGSISALVHDVSGSMLASAGYDGVRLWRRDRSQDEPRRLLGPSQTAVDSRVVENKLHPQGRWLALGCEDGSLRLVEMAGPAPAITFRHARSKPILSVAFDPSNRWLASLGEDATVRLFPLPPSMEKPLVLRHRKKSPTRALAFDAFGRLLALGFKDGSILMWSLDQPSHEPRSLRAGSANILKVAFDPTSRRLAVARFDPMTNDICLLSPDDPDLSPLPLPGRSTEPFGGISDIAFDPMGRWLAACWFDGYLCLWAVDDPQGGPVLLEPETGWGVEIRHRIAFSADGKWLANLTNNRTVTLWRLSPQQFTRQAELPFPDEGQGASVAFDPLSHRLVALSDHGHVFQWTLDVEALCRKACLVAGRNLTQQEWELYFGDEAKYRPTCFNDSDG